MWYQILEFGGLLFFGLLAVITLIISSQVEEEKFGWATITFILTILAIVAFTNSPIPGLIRDHPSYLIYGFLAYLVVAAAWALIKWRVFFLPNLFEKYDELRSKFLRGKGLDEMPANQTVRDEFNKQYDVAALNIGHRRMVRNNKARITSWMAFWPFSLLGTFVGDFLYRVFTTIYKGIAAMLQRMSDSMASRYSELD